jgi:hypothetical protein
MINVLNWDSAVGLVANLGDSGYNFGRVERYFSSSKRPDRLWYPPSYLCKNTVLFFRVKCEVDHSPPSRVEVKNKCCYTSNLPVCLRSVDRDKFTFLPLRYTILYVDTILSYWSVFTKGTNDKSTINPKAEEDHSLQRCDMYSGR